MLYLSALALGITGVVGVVLAYVWRSEQPDGWEASHYTYLIRGFWLWLAGCVVGILLLVVVIGAVHPARRFRPDRDPRDPVDHPRAEPRADAQPGDLAAPDAAAVAAPEWRKSAGSTANKKIKKISRTPEPFSRGARFSYQATATASLPGLTLKAQCR